MDVLGLIDGDNVYKNTDTENNLLAQITALEHGVKTRDFIMTFNPQDKRSQDSSPCTSITVFQAREKALTYKYHRSLWFNERYGMPNAKLLPEDVDRLFTCGYISEDELDFPLGRTMLAHGVLRREARRNGLPSETGKILPPRGYWTIPADSTVPDEDEIRRYIDQVNNYQHYHTRSGASSTYSKVDLGYAQKRYEIDGLFGLKGYGIEDEVVIKLYRSKDPSYIRPGEYTAAKHHKYPQDSAPDGTLIPPSYLETVSKGALPKIRWDINNGYYHYTQENPEESKQEGEKCGRESSAVQASASMGVMGNDEVMGVRVSTPSSCQTTTPIQKRKRRRDDKEEEENNCQSSLKKQKKGKGRTSVFSNKDSTPTNTPTPRRSPRNHRGTT